jgi:hypothetical protein
MRFISWVRKPLCIGDFHAILVGWRGIFRVGTGDCCPKLEISRHARLRRVSLTRDLENIQPLSIRDWARLSQMANCFLSQFEQFPHFIRFKTGDLHGLPRRK